MPRAKKTRLKREKVVRVDASTRLTARGIESIVTMDDGGYRAGGVPAARQFLPLPLLKDETVPPDQRGVVVRRERQGFRYPREGIVVSVYGKRELRACLLSLRWLRWAKTAREGDIIERAARRALKHARTERESAAALESLKGAARTVEYLFTVSLRSRKRGVTKDQIDNLIFRMSEYGGRVYFPVSMPGSNSSNHRTITGHVQPTARQMANWRAACALADYVGMPRPERPGTKLRRREYVVFAVGDEFLRETFIVAPQRRADAAASAADTRRRNAAAPAVPPSPDEEMEAPGGALTEEDKERDAEKTAALEKARRERAALELRVSMQADEATRLAAIPIGLLPVRVRHELRKRGY